MLARWTCYRSNLRWQQPVIPRCPPSISVKPAARPISIFRNAPVKRFQIVNQAIETEDQSTSSLDTDTEESYQLLEKLKELEPSKQEDLLPLAEALEKALQRKAKAQGIKEAVEAEAQEVAQLAVNSYEQKIQADSALAEAIDKKEELIKEQESQLVTLERLNKKCKEFEVLVKQQQSTTVTDGQEPQTPDVESTVLRDLDMENLGDPQVIVTKIQLKIDEFNKKIFALGAKINAVQEEINECSKRAEEAVASVRKAEDMAAAAMSEAESAVRNEMDATAILEQTEKALQNALGGLQVPTKRKEKVEEPLLIDRAEKPSFLEAKEGWEDVIMTEDELEEERELETDLLKTEDLLIEPPQPWYTTNLAKIIGLSALVFATGFAIVNHTIVGQTLAVWARGFPAAFGEFVAGLGPEELPEEIGGILKTIALLLTSVIFVPLVVKLLPGGSPVLGFLVGGAVIGPHGLGIINNIEQVKHLAELGIVLLLFNIGLELSLERLQALGKYVFGLGLFQVLVTTLVIAGVAMTFGNMHGAASVILGGALSLSTTAVAMQVLQDRGESGSRHGRATFSVLLFQDLAVVVLLMLIPLLAPSENGAGGLSRIAKALALAGVKAVVCIVGIIAGGRVLVRPLYRKVSAFQNPDVFAATTLLMVLGTSVLTQIAGLSLALGAFLAGLLLAETEYALQVESDIAPYKGLLMGLFFMTVGMEISMKLLFAKWQHIFLSMVVLVAGKTAIMGALGTAFGLSRLASFRAGLFLAAGGEFAFVALGDAVARGVIPATIAKEMYMVVILSMALVPYLAQAGQEISQRFDAKDVKGLSPQEGETKDLRDHVIICGFGRIGQIIAQLLSERLIQFVALDVRADRVAAGKQADLPVFYGDAGSASVLHSIRADKAKCAVITLDTPGANYRSVWALSKNFPNLKIFVRAHDVLHGINLEKAGANVVVPETLEPSLQLSAAVLGSMNIPPDELDEIISEFRRSHLAELQNLAALSKSSLGYGFQGKKDGSLSESSTTQSSQQISPREQQEPVDAQPAFVG
eukprot:TRINITY_DN5396_c0_g2_i1.p1 TRINITY_DN5396_c0_g2~~TRINITY_DN5396_c0_g2_i1.p1  ORF type:complete len:1037 (-),score=181.77 TRINITY_DN5396_c0_g2_i1:364-3474(-)